MHVGKLQIILHVLAVVISIWDGQNAENTYFNACPYTLFTVG